MKITPFQIVNQLPLIEAPAQKVEVDEEAVNEILTASGILNADSNSAKAEDQNVELKKAFIQVGADLEAVAQNVYNIACRGESETARISANKFIAEIHGVKTKLEEMPKPAMNISINIVGKEQKGLINLVMPKA